MIRSALGRLRRRLPPRRPPAPFEEELAFWRTYLLDHGREACDRTRWEAVFPSPLLGHVERLRAQRARSPKLLEVGSGPVSLLAWGVDQGLFELTAIDPLAREYARLTRELPCSYPVTPTLGFGEDLLTRFSPSTFDLAYSGNALDHASSPRRCMEELTQVVDDGGIIYCEGFVREGTNAGWQGLHRHDLVPEGGHLVRYGRDGQRSAVSEGLPLELLAQSVHTLGDRGLKSHGYEWDPGSERDWRLDDWYTLVFAVRQGHA
jgi:SAM-dependent methyltransferase